MNNLQNCLFESVTCEIKKNSPEKQEICIKKNETSKVYVNTSLAKVFGFYSDYSKHTLSQALNDHPDIYDECTKQIKNDLTGSSYDYVLLNSEENYSHKDFIFDGNFYRPSLVKIICEEVYSPYSPNSLSELLAIVPINSSENITSYTFLNPLKRKVNSTTNFLNLKLTDIYDNQLYFSSHYPTFLKMSTLNVNNESFSLSVFSNDSNSKKHFPGNTSKKFTIILPKEIVLDGDWRISVESAIIPYNINSIFESVNEFTIQDLSTNVEYKFKITPQKYTVSTLVAHLGELLDHLGISVKISAGVIMLEQINSIRHGFNFRFSMKRELAMFLGVAIELADTPDIIFHFSNKYFKFKAEPNLDIFFPNIINILSDFTSPVYFNTKRQPVLKSINIGGMTVFGKNSDPVNQYFHGEFVKKHSVQIQKSSLRTLTFELVSGVTNLPIAFGESTIPVVINLDLHKF